MNSNYAKRAEETKEFDKNLKEVATNAPTLESKAKLSDKEIFGDNFVTVAREKIGADKILLTDEMIKAKLHLDVAKKSMGKLLKTEKYKDNETEIREITIMYLCASICKALANRVKDIKFASYADVNYHQNYVDFLYKANNEKVRLLSKLGLM